MCGLIPRHGILCPLRLQSSAASRKSIAMMARASSIVGSLAAIVTGLAVFKCSYRRIVSCLSVIVLIDASCSVVEFDAVSTSGSFDCVSTYCRLSKQMIKWAKKHK